MYFRQLQLIFTLQTELNMCNLTSEGARLVSLYAEDTPMGGITMNKYVIAAAVAVSGFGTAAFCRWPRRDCRCQLVQLSGRTLENR